MVIRLTPDREVFNFCKPYVIAELGANHNGDMELARKLIVEAKEAGADCVKFQSWTKNSVFSKIKYEENHFLHDDYRDRDDTTLEEIVDAYAISEDELLEMKAFADEVCIDCTSTPFSEAETDFLVEKMDTPFIKIASMDLSNYPFLDYVARKGKPIVISTGLSEMYEVDRAIRTIEEAGNTDIVILHCVSMYPPQDSQVNLRNIETLQKAYPDYPVGFSDHTLGTSICLASAVMGVAIIEKHYTLDKDMPGWDHKVSANFEEMKVICEDTKRINEALGSTRVSAIETPEQREQFRRSIVLTRDLAEGEVIGPRDVTCKRPGTGLKPELIDFVVGRRVNRAIEDDTILTLDDLM